MGNGSCQINFSSEGLKCLAKWLTENNGSPHGFAPKKLPPPPPPALAHPETSYNAAPAPTAPDYEQALRTDPISTDEMIIRRPDRELSPEDTRVLARAVAGVAIMGLINGAMRCAFNNGEVGYFEEGFLKTWERNPSDR